MKAAICYEFGKPLVIEDIDIDPPKTGEIQVDMKACAICHSDIHYMDGGWGGVLPAVYGHEGAGIVKAVGEGVARVAAGDPVVVSLIRSCDSCFYCEQDIPCMCEAAFPLDEKSRIRTKDGTALQQGLRTGAFAQSVVVHESQVVPVPVEMPLDRASLLACGVITGFGAVTNTARIPEGSSVVVIGCGGVGLNSIQGACLSGATPVIAMDLSDSKLEAARRFGATQCINPKETDARVAVREHTSGRGADYVFVTVGSAKAMEQGLTLLQKLGTLVIVGMSVSGDTMQIDAADFASFNQRIIACKMGSSRPDHDIPKLVALYLAGKLKLDELISGRFPLAEINRAVSEVKEGRALRNVIVFE